MLMNKQRSYIGFMGRDFVSAFVPLPPLGVCVCILSMRLGKYDEAIPNGELLARWCRLAKEKKNLFVRLRGTKV